MNADEKLKRVEVQGLKFVVRDGSSDLKAIQEVVASHSYEKRDFKIAGGKWVDLGANVGTFTVLAASRGAEVVACEPDPDNFALLEQNVLLNGLRKRVRLVNAAVVWDARTHVVLHVNGARKNYWRNSILKTWQGGSHVKVAAVHYAELLGDGSAQVKMDIEGCEMPILEALDARPGERLVFEWSFDIDRSIPRFSAVMEKLRRWYPTVAYSGFDETLAAWPSSWFPPCRTVWCY